MLILLFYLSKLSLLTKKVYCTFSSLLRYVFIFFTKRTFSICIYCYSMLTHLFNFSVAHFECDDTLSRFYSLAILSYFFFRLSLALCVKLNAIIADYVLFSFFHFIILHDYDCVTMMITLKGKLYMLGFFFLLFSCVFTMPTIWNKTEITIFEQEK